MNYITDTKKTFNVTDFTLLDENVSDKNLLNFYSDYQQYASIELPTASFCVFPQDLTTLSETHDEIINPCVVINFPHADNDNDKIAEDIALAAKFGAEIDLVFPTVKFLENTLQSKNHTKELLETYKNEIAKHDFKVVKMIFDTTYYNYTENQKEKLNVDMLSKALDIVYKSLYSKNYKLFFKTSTGKVFQGEDHTRAVKLFDGYIKNLGGLNSCFNENLGIKVSGGVSNQNIVQHYLNSLSNAKHYMENDLFRVGASGLLGNIQPLQDITVTKVKSKKSRNTY